MSQVMRERLMPMPFRTRTYVSSAQCWIEAEAAGQLLCACSVQPSATVTTRAKIVQSAANRLKKPKSACTDIEALWPGLLRMLIEDLPPPVRHLVGRARQADDSFRTHGSKITRGGRGGEGGREKKEKDGKRHHLLHGKKRPGKKLKSKPGGQEPTGPNLAR